MLHCLLLIGGQTWGAALLLLPPAFPCLLPVLRCVLQHALQVPRGLLRMLEVLHHRGHEEAGGPLARPAAPLCPPVLLLLLLFQLLLLLLFQLLLLLLFLLLLLLLFLLLLLLLLLVMRMLLLLLLPLLLLLAVLLLPLACLLQQQAAVLQAGPLLAHLLLAACPVQAVQPRLQPAALQRPRPACPWQRPAVPLQTRAQPRPLVQTCGGGLLLPVQTLPGCLQPLLLLLAC